MTRETFFFKKHVENEAGRLVPDLFLFFKTGLYGKLIVSIYFDSPQLGIQQKQTV